MANRIWQHVFGAGLVVTGGDFGRAGLPQSSCTIGLIAANFQPTRPDGSPGQ